MTLSARIHIRHDIDMRILSNRNSLKQSNHKVCSVMGKGGERGRTVVFREHVARTKGDGIDNISLLSGRSW